MNLEGRCAVVTGAASGLGRATVEGLYSAGANVVLIDMLRDQIEPLAEALGANAIAVGADVRDAAEVQAAITAAKKNFGTVHIAVNCAGVASAVKTVFKGSVHSIDEWQRVIDINLTGTFNVIRLAAAMMATNEPDCETGERGVIINTASGAAFDGQRGQAAYAASKAGVVGLSLPVARDLCDLAVRCVAIAPGLFDTRMVEDISKKALEGICEGMLYPPRMGHPSEFAALVRHIIENPYINGTCLRLDGGARLSGPKPTLRQ